MRLFPFVLLAACAGLSLVWVGQSPAEDDAAPAPEHRVSLDVARDRAKLMHNIYATTLEVLHHRYFHGERAMVPARAMEDIFAELDRQMNVRSRWISVNTRAMSLTHEPKSELDKRAAAELATGKEAFELIENGQYYRAAPIALGAGCVSCHDGFFRSPPKSPRFAGLIVTIPLAQE